MQSPFDVRHAERDLGAHAHGLVHLTVAETVAGLGAAPVDGDLPRGRARGRVEANLTCLEREDAIDLVGRHLEIERHPRLLWPQGKKTLLRRGRERSEHGRRDYEDALPSGHALPFRTSGLPRDSARDAWHIPRSCERAMNERPRKLTLQIRNVD